MKLAMIPVLIAFSLPACMHCQVVASGQAQQSISAFAGVWRGEFEGLPGVDIVISDEGGQATGGILFYFHSRPDVNSQWTSKPGLPEPMFSMKLDGETLRFQVSHRRAHPPSTLNDPPVSFLLTLTGPGKAKLVNDSEGSGPPMVMTRSDY
jgi:hypothetical protein